MIPFVLGCAHLDYYMKFNRFIGSKLAKVLKRMVIIEERALEMQRVEKKVQFVLIEIEADTWCLKEVLNEARAKLMSTKEEVRVVNEKVSKREVEVIKQACKAMEDFRSSN